MERKGYLPGIDGLRAIAVLSVVIYHAGINELSGGFIGVDIFYVISGYLITLLISKSLIEENFSFLTFYARRSKRLLPAAIVMIIFSILLGSLFLTTDAYISLSKSAIYSNIFAANIWFMNNSGYFDLSSQVSPLVHMWSLSVEEQFYLIFPFILFISYQIGKLRAVKIVIISSIVLSLAACILLSSKYPNFSFYMIFTRAWELGVGAAVVFLPKAKNENRQITLTISTIGLLLIAYSLMFISEQDVYPGHLALYPVIGSALLIYTLTNSNNFISATLSSKPFLLIGKSSYSIYLWHWPIIVYYRLYINQRDFNLIEILLLIISSIIAGYFSWKYIEERYRYLKHPPLQILTLSMVAAAFSVTLSGLVYVFEGFPQRISDSEIAITDSSVMWEFPCTENLKIIPELEEDFCVIGAPWKEGTKKGLVWGDSHSQHWAQLLNHEAIKNNISLVIAPKHCPPYLNSNIVSEHYIKFPNFTDECTKRNTIALDWVNKNENIELLILAAAWSGHARMLYTDIQPTNRSSNPIEKRDADIGASLSTPAFHQLLSQLQNKKILIIGDIPRPNKILNDCAASDHTQLIRRKCNELFYKQLDYNEIKKWHHSSDEVLLSLSSKYDNVTTIIPSKTLCTEEKCETYLNDELIYKDDNHIRRNLSTNTVVLFSKTLGLDKYISSI